MGGAMPRRRRVHTGDAAILAVQGPPSRNRAPTSKCSSAAAAHEKPAGPGTGRQHARNIPDKTFNEVILARVAKMRSLPILFRHRRLHAI